MSGDGATPTVTVKMTLAKFDGEFEEGKGPVEVIESVETISLAEWLALQNQED